MNAVLLSARGQLKEARRAAQEPIRWIVDPRYYDASRDELEKAGALIATIDQTPTILGLPYDFGGTHDRSGIDLIVEGCR